MNRTLARAVESLNPAKYVKKIPKITTTTTASAYEHFVAEMASKLAVRNLRATGRATPAAVRNAERTAYAAAAAMHYDTTRDPLVYAQPIAETILHTI